MEKAGHNPWKANSLEWLTSTVPPEHGNFGERLPVVHRWPYDFSVPGAKEDFITQTTPPSEVVHTKVEKTRAIYMSDPKIEGFQLKPGLEEWPMILAPIKQCSKAFIGARQ